MKIKENDLDGFASEIVSKCLSTRRDRITAYEGLKHYYLFGAQQGDQAPYGKIYPHLDLLTAYLYSQSTVEFDVAVQNQPKEIFQQASLVSDKLNTCFHDYGVADLFGEALQWSLVFNSCFLKLNWGKHGLEPKIVTPQNLGVLQEEVNNLADQEAFVHTYLISQHELNRRIQVLPNSADIMRRVSPAPMQEDDTFPEAVNRMLVAGTVDMTKTTTRGMVNVPELLNQLQYKPRTLEDMVEMYELWVWDDDQEDYRTITVAEPGVVIYGRKTIGNIMGIKGETPFIHICPNRLYDYFFGWSEIVNLIKLQDWASERLRQIRWILTKQANPPKVFSGFGGITDEKYAAFDQPGSWLSEPTPNAKAELVAPNVPEDVFQEIMMIQNMFNDVSGINDILQGKGEAGVRSKGHADTLKTLGSARIKKRALSVERSLEETGERLIKLLKAKDPAQMKLESGTPFVLSQFTNDYQVHVDAHSASPVFVDDHQQLVFALAKFGFIDGESAIDLTKPPKKDQLKLKYKEHQAQLQKQQQMQQQQEAQQGQPSGGPKIRAA